MKISTGWEKSAEINMCTVFHVGQKHVGGLRFWPQTSDCTTGCCNPAFLSLDPKSRFRTCGDEGLKLGLTFVCVRAASESEGSATMSMGSWFSGMRERSADHPTHFEPIYAGPVLGKKWPDIRWINF